MKALISAGVLGLAALAATATQAQSVSGVLQNDAAFRATTITLSASGDILASPDVAVLHLGVETEAPTATQAIGLNAHRMGEVIAGLRKDGIAAKDLRTSSLQLVRQETGGRLVGYQARNWIDVTLYDLKRVGGVLDDAVSLGANRVQGVDFSVSKVSAALDAARQEAVRKLQAKAELYARATGLQVVRLVTLTESVTPPSAYGDIVVTARRVSFEDTPVEPGQLQGGVRVTGVYELGR